jgi:parvulin-like peptidyl-prolyl isomerase
LARRPPGRRTTARAPDKKPEEKKISGRRTAIITTAVVFAVIAISIVVSLYFSVWKDLWSPVIKVNDETISMDYLIRRMKYFDETDDIIDMMTTLTEEEFIRQGAPRYGIEVTEDEIDDLIRDIARGENETISESEFKVWYRNVLNETKLSEAEYREWVGTNIMAGYLYGYLVANINTVAEQVHLYIIALPSYEETEAALTRLENGEDFSELARELSIDEESGELGGDAGWWPRGGGLHLNVEYWAFALEVGELSGAIGLDDDNEIFAICMVTEKQLREIEEDKLETIKGNILQEWLYDEWDTVDYKWLNLDGGDFDDYTLQWINLQLLKD